MDMSQDDVCRSSVCPVRLWHWKGWLNALETGC